MTPDPIPHARESASEVLRSLEWCGESYGLPPYCPVCKRLERFGQHEPHCRIAAALADPTPAPSGDDVAELQAENERLRRSYAHLFDEAHGTPCEQIRHKQEVERYHRRAQKAEGALERLGRRDVLATVARARRAEKRATAAEARGKALEEALDQSWRRVIGYSFSQVCKHYVAAHMLSEMEKLGFDVPMGLARAVVNCADDTALAWPALSQHQKGDQDA